VQLLLERGGVNPDTPDCLVPTPLFHAATNVHEGIVRLLLGRGGISPDRLDKLDRTPLLYAAMHGHRGVVQLLLGQGIPIPTGQTGSAERRSRMLPAMDTKEWCTSCSGGVSIPINQTVLTERHYCMLLGTGTMEWCRYYWDEGMSTPTGETTSA